METSVQLFKNQEFGEIRVAGTSEEPLFCLADLCEAIGIANSRNVKDRLDKDDVCLVDTIDKLGRIQQVTFVTESGMYDVIIRSDSDRAKPFRKWITNDVLPSIRRTGSYSVKSEPLRIGINEISTWIECVAKSINLNDNSKLQLYYKAKDSMGEEGKLLPLPDYTQSKGVLKSATDLLKEHGIKIATPAFNIQAEKLGYISTQTRQSSNGTIKKFKTITEKGKEYGENQVSPRNPRETQPLWYADRFMALLRELGY